MNKRKIVLLAVALCMVAILGFGGTLAYLQDSDHDANVMIAGNVNIVQNENTTTGAPFGTEPKKLVPAVYDNLTKDQVPDYDGTFVAENGKTYKMWTDAAIDNVVDKVISVTNNGTEPAYVRTILLFENNTDNSICEVIHTLWTDIESGNTQTTKWVLDAPDNMVTLDGVTYSVAVCTYHNPLPAGETSAPSLRQLFLDPSAGNEWKEMLGKDGQLNIFALSQAVQSQGFEDKGTDTLKAAEVALNTAFGEVTVANVEEWMENPNTYTEGY